MASSRESVWAWFTDHASDIHDRTCIGNDDSTVNGGRCKQDLAVSIAINFQPRDGLAESEIRSPWHCVIRDKLSDGRKICWNTKERTLSLVAQIEHEAKKGLCDSLWYVLR